MKPVDKRTFSICLAIILMLSIPLCFFVFMSPPQIITLWLNDNFWFSDNNGRPDTSRDPLYLSRDQIYRSRDSPSTSRELPFAAPNTASGGSRDHARPANGDEVPLLLLVSYDGFRYDYIQKNLHVAPTFQWLIKYGVFATEGLKNTFITITAPNHYGIVTGLYEENHGVIANSFFDPDLNETFEYFTTRWKTNPKFFGGQPVWNVNDAAGDKRATGCMMWVGCDVPINNHTPPIHRVSWDQNLAWPARVDSVVSWFKHPKRPVNFGLLYIEEPDETGHMFGPDSPNITTTIEKLDRLTAYLLARLYMADLLDKINIIFTADHGMASVPILNAIDLDKYINRSLYTVYGGTPNWNVKPVPGKEQEVYEALHGKVPHLKVYNKSDIPEDYHYKSNDRIMPLQLESDVHWWISYNYTENLKFDQNDGNSTKNMPSTIEREIRGKKVVINLKASNYTTGEHGYNNSYPDMHPYFIGYGPAFKKGFNVTQFMNVDLYPLMCYILELKPPPNNGSFTRVRAILKDEGRKWVRTHRRYQKWSKFSYFPFLTTTTERSSVDGFTIDYEFSSFYTNNNVDLVVMLFIVVGYILFMLFLTSSLKRYELKNKNIDQNSNKSQLIPREKNIEKNDHISFINSI